MPVNDFQNVISVARVVRDYATGLQQEFGYLNARMVDSYAGGTGEGSVYDRIAVVKEMLGHIVADLVAAENKRTQARYTLTRRSFDPSVSDYVLGVYLGDAGVDSAIRAVHDDCNSDCISWADRGGDKFAMANYDDESVVYYLKRNNG